MRSQNNKLILDWPRWLATVVVEGTEATVVDEGVVVVAEVPVSLVLTLQLLVETAGDFDAFPGSLQGGFF